VEQERIPETGDFVERVLSESREPGRAGDSETSVRMAPSKKINF